MKILKYFISILCMLQCFGVYAQPEKPKKVIIVDGYFFNSMPVAKTDIAKMHIINAMSGTTALGLELSKSLPDEAIQYAVPIEEVADGEELLERYNEAISKSNGIAVTITKKGIINEGDKFPEFTAIDIYGKTWTNVDIKGKVMVLNLWFSGCSPCIAEMPELSRWKNEMPDVMFFSATYEDAEQAMPIIECQGFNWIALINDKQFTEFIGSNGYPMTIVVDKLGIVKKVEYGTSLIQLLELKKFIQLLR